MRSCGAVAGPTRHCTRPSSNPHPNHNVNLNPHPSPSLSLSLTLTPTLTLTRYVVESKGGLRITPKDCNGTGPTLLTNSRREHRPYHHRGRTCGRANHHGRSNGTTSGHLGTTNGHPNHLGARAAAMLSNLTVGPQLKDLVPTLTLTLTHP